MRLLILFSVFLFNPQLISAKESCRSSIDVSRGLNCDTLRAKWFNFITGNKISGSDPAIKTKIELITKNAETNWTKGFVTDTMNRHFLWNDLKFNSSADLTTTYRRLRTMALAYALSGSGLYQNKKLKDDILAAMDWLYRNKYNEHVVVPKSGGKNNWWDYRIGAPEELNNITILMYEELGKDRRDIYVRTVKHCVPNVNRYTGANLLWIAKVIALNGIIDHDVERVTYARNAIKPVFDYVKEGDGFYEDGSFIQHGKHPYTGGYGIPLIGSLAELLYLFPSIKKDIPSSDHVYDWVYNAFDPLMFRGGIMSMSMGREIARSTTSEHGKGKAVVETLILLAASAPEVHAMRLKSLVKDYILSDKIIGNYLSRLSTITMMQMGKAIMDDKHILPRTPAQIYKQFVNMDRVVQQNPDFAFGISMHSTRIFNYESINGENLKGWNTSNGMTYLYNADLNHYNNNYWSTIDYQRLPGTTVDLKAAILPSKTSKSDWAGGASIKAVALALARKGCNIGLHYNSNEEKAALVAEEIRKLGVEVVLLQADFREPDSVAEMGRLAWKEQGRIDFLVNNAGVSYKKHFLDISMDDVDHFMNINFKSTLMLTQTVLLNMVASGVEGGVFTVTSVNALQPGVGLSAYGASKAALETLMKGAALEMAVHNIKINTIAVGAVETAMTEAVWQQPDLLEKVNAAIPMGRLGKPDEIAAVIAALISANTYMTGSTITIDGGWMMGQGFARPRPYGS